MHLDLFGNELKPGDYIVYAAVDGRSGTLRVGRIIELRDNGKVFCKSWSNFRQHTWSGAPKSGRQKNVTLSFTDRMIAVDASTISAKIISDLDGGISDFWGDVK